MGTRPGRLRSSAAVRAVFAARASAASPLAVVHVRDRGDAGPARATVVAGRKVGNAVQRNRVKRRLRAALIDAALRDGRDYVVVGRPAALHAAADVLWATLQRQLEDVNRR